MRTTKMFTELFIAAYFCAVFGSSSGLTITKSRGPAFPGQFANAANENSFFRINGDNRIELLTCPDGFTFDIKDLKCRYISKPKWFSANAARNEIACPGDFRGTLPNSLNCRSFLNCWDGVGFETECAAHLLYSNIIRNCDWPEKANCCEFWEKDSTKIVADM